MKRIYVEMEEELHGRLKILAAKRRKTIKLLAPELLSKAIKEEELKELQRKNKHDNA